MATKREKKYAPATLHSSDLSLWIHCICSQSHDTIPLKRKISVSFSTVNITLLSSAAAPHWSSPFLAHAQLTAILERWLRSSWNIQKWMWKYIFSIKNICFQSPGNAHEFGLRTPYDFVWLKWPIFWSKKDISPLLLMHSFNLFFFSILHLIYPFMFYFLFFFSHFPPFYIFPQNDFRRYFSHLPGGGGGVIFQNIDPCLAWNQSWWIDF